MIGRALLLAASIASLAAGLATGWWTHGIWFDRIERPAIVHEQETICLSRTEAAASTARADEQLRQFRAGDMAASQFDIKQQQAADDWAAQRTVLEREIADYETRLDENGRVCALDADDVRFLGGMLDDLGQAAGGGGAAGAGPGGGDPARPAGDVPHAR